MLDMDGDGNPLDDILEMAGKVMRQRRGAVVMPGAKWLGACQRLAAEHQPPYLGS
jgi:hypothetical protein